MFEAAGGRGQGYSSIEIAARRPQWLRRLENRGKRLRAAKAVKPFAMTLWNALFSHDMIPPRLVVRDRKQPNAAGKRQQLPLMLVLKSSPVVISRSFLSKVLVFFGIGLV